MTEKPPTTAGPRFVPCRICGESPAIHNGHPLNPNHPGHDYEVEDPTGGRAVTNPWLAQQPAVER